MNATITDIGAAKRERFFDAATSGLEDYVSKLEATGVRATDAIIVLRTFTMPGGHNVSFVRMQHLADAFGPGMPDFIEDNRTLINDGMFIVGVVDEQDNWSWFSFGLAPEPTLEQKTAWHFRRTKQATDVSTITCMACIRNLRAAGLLPDEPGTTRREDLRLLESLAADLLTTDSRLSEAVTRAMEALEKAGAR